MFTPFYMFTNSKFAMDKNSVRQNNNHKIVIAVKTYKIVFINVDIIAIIRRAVLTVVPKIKVTKLFCRTRTN